MVPGHAMRFGWADAWPTPRGRDKAHTAGTSMGRGEKPVKRRFFLNSTLFFWFLETLRTSNEATWRR